MAKFALFLVATLALAGVASAGMGELRAKIANKFHHKHHNGHGPHMYQGGGGGGASADAAAYAGNNGYGGDAASAAAAAQANGGYGGSSASAAAAASTTGNSGYQPHHVPHHEPSYYQAPVYQQHHARPVPSVYQTPVYPQTHYQPTGYQPTLYQPSYQPGYQQHHQVPVYGHNGASAAAAASAGAGAGSAASAAAASGASGYGASQAAAAASAAAGASGYGAAQAGGLGSNFHQSGYGVNYNPHPTTFMSTTGTLGNLGRNSESSAFRRATEDVHNVENGRADDNHYYNAQSFGKSVDDNSHEAYNDANEDVVETPGLFHSKKMSTNYVNDKNHSLRESGSGVLAQDNHSSAYNKNFKHFNENVDQSNRREADGFVESNALASATHFNDDDEMRFDSDGLGGFHGGHGAAGSAAAAASSAVGGQNGGVATSAAAAAAAANGAPHY